MSTDQHKLRYNLWSKAFENAEFALVTAERLQKRHNRALKKHARKNSGNFSMVDLPDVDYLLVISPGMNSDGTVDGVRVDNLNVGGLGHEECLFICDTLREEACIEIMTIFGPMGDGGTGVVANDTDEMKGAREGVVEDISNALKLTKSDVWDQLNRVKDRRNKVIAHRSGAEMKNAQLLDHRESNTTLQGVSFYRDEKPVIYDLLRDICEAGRVVADRLAFP